MASKTRLNPAAAMRPPRQQLLFQFDMHRDQLNASEFQYFLPDAYPPCTAPLDSLSPINIEDLEPDVHHRGKVLFVRTLDDPIRSAAVQSIVEDPTGVADHLALYNCDAAANADDLIPQGSIFAVKEPFYPIVPNVGCSIRIDHPSDLVRLPSFDPMVPHAFRTGPSERTALQWKDEGNAAFKAKDYATAIHLYSQALKNADIDVQTASLVLRNRALVNTYMDRWEPALTDATAAFDSTSEDTGVANAKGLFRAGRAAYLLGRFDDAKSHFRKALELDADDKDTQADLRRADVRLEEQNSGAYNFQAMSKSSSTKRNRLDHANYFPKTDVHEAPGRGRGLFASDNFAAGEVILCEKAFAVSFDSDPETAQNNWAILNKDTERNAAGTQATLAFRIVKKLLYNPELATQFFELYAGGYGDKPTLVVEPQDGAVSVDTFRVQAILDHNSYGCPTTRSSSKAAQKQAGAGSQGYPSTGSWLRASYINHACDGNAMRSFIGDVMIVRATKSIAVGDEITMPYRLPHPDNRETQAELEKLWGFRCGCDICVSEAESSFRSKKERMQLLAKLETDVLSKHSLPLKKKPEKSLIEKTNNLYTRLEKTYDANIFENRPRIGLVRPSKFLCEAHRLNDAHDKVIESSLGLLRNLGFVISISDDEVKINRQHAAVQSTAIDAAMYAAQALRSKSVSGNQAADKMEQFARELYEMMNGEKFRGFDELYGNSTSDVDLNGLSSDLKKKAVVA